MSDNTSPSSHRAQPELLMPQALLSRTAERLAAEYEGIFSTQTVERYARGGLTGPTCWAYPDMLMVGVQGQTPDELHVGYGPWQDFVQPTVTEQRTHFGLWCVLSSPLTLSLCPSLPICFSVFVSCISWALNS